MSVIGIFTANFKDNYCVNRARIITDFRVVKEDNSFEYEEGIQIIKTDKSHIDGVIEIMRMTIHFLISKNLDVVRDNISLEDIMVVR
jgi:hypothetical protein